MTTFKQFKTAAAGMGMTMPELRCDIPPTRKILDFMQEVGTDNYERFVLRMEREQERQSKGKA